MASSAFVILGALLAALAAGLAVYEGLNRIFSPPRHSLDARPVRTQGQEATDSHARTRQNRTGIALLASSLVEAIAPITAAKTAEYRGRLERAGITMAPGVWRGAVCLCAAGAGILVPLASTLVARPTLAGTALGALFGVVLGWAGARYYLIRRTLRRKHILEQQLPDAMEFLGISVAAGAPLEHCFRTVALHIAEPLSKEFAHVDAMVHRGDKTREEALTALAQRCRSAEITAFCTSLIYAASHGANIAENLALQAENAKQEAQAKTMERIKKMATKLSAVLSLCCLPPIAALICAPIISDLLAFVNNVM